MEGAKFLLHRCANIETGNRDGRPPLIHAARGGHEAIVKWLLRYGAYRGARDAAGATAATLAAKEQRHAIVKLLD